MQMQCTLQNPSSNRPSTLNTCDPDSPLVTHVTVAHDNLLSLAPPFQIVLCTTHPHDTIPQDAFGISKSYPVASMISSLRGATTYRLNFLPVQCRQTSMFTWATPRIWF